MNAILKLWKIKLDDYRNISKFLKKKKKFIL